MNWWEKVEFFLESTSSLPKMIVIYWPTASGKTALSLEVAKHLQSEIISTDSRQIYKYLNIGTGKILPHEMDGIPHHMIDFLDPSSWYSVWEFKNEAQKIIKKLHSQNKIPILAGGTWLYIDSLIYDFDIPKIPEDKKLREKLTQQAHDFGKEFVYKQLLEIDSEYAREIHPNNLNYVIRAIEVKLLSWRSKKDFQTQKILKYDTLFLTPYTWEREKLYKKINSRIGEMFEFGLVEEVENILNMWYHKNHPWLKTIWYKEVIEYLEWSLTREECREKVQQANRNYAKRQLTWFRKYEKNH